MTTNTPITLKTLLGKTPRTEALMSGRVTSDLVKLEIDDVAPVTNGFPAMVRHMPYDFGELAFLTYMQARVAGKPLVVLPFVVAAEYLHPYVHYNSKHGRLTPKDLAGKRLGVRSYTQTTGLWIRGFLEEDYDIPLEKQHWVCFQEPHVQQYKEPAFVERAPAGKTLEQMLLDGEIDAAVGLGGEVIAQHPELHRLFPDGTGEEWSRRTGIFPINHMAVLRRSVYDSSPRLSSELFRMLVDSKKAAVDQPGPDIRPYGVAPNRRGMELSIRWAVRQQLLQHPIEVDDLFDGTTSQLGV